MSGVSTELAIVLSAPLMLARVALAFAA